MRYGEIIQKAWKITWRYKFLWVLALFAGVTGPGGSGGGGGGGGSFSLPGDSGSNGTPFGNGAFPRIGDVQSIIVLLLVIAFISIVLLLVWTVLSLSARAGLIWAVDQIESGTVPRLGPAWRVGFSRFWRMLGMRILAGIPVFAVVLFVILGAVVPIVLAAQSGEQIGGAIVSMCGVLLITVPLVIVLAFILGIVVPVAERAIVLEDARVLESLSRGWWAFRRRFKDSALMWLVSWGLNIAASLAFAIPVIFLSIALLMPALFAAFSGNWGTVAGFGGVWLLVMIVLSFAFAAIWGTYTSALWTIFFRRLVGKEVLPPSPESYVNAPPRAPGGPYETPPPYAPQPPMPPGPPMPPQSPQPPQPPGPPPSPPGGQFPNA